MATKAVSNATPYENTVKDFVADVRGKFKTLATEISERNQKITLRDDYIYGDRLEKTLDIPVGHDFTPVNWLRRTVEIHKNMFMSRGFQVLSTYDSADLGSVDDSTNPDDKKQMEIDNQKSKQYAEARMKLIKSIMRDNDGDALWSSLAESASAVGDACVKTYYDEDEKKFEICAIESIENIYALWSKDNFREVDAYAYVYQVSRQEAVSDYGADENVATSPVGSPMEVLSSTGVSNQFSGQPMVSILEITGKMEGWKTNNGRVEKCKVGNETEFNCKIIGNDLTSVIDDPKKLPKYYILPNKRQRRRPWGMSDISDPAISINLTYIETLSDWRTLASKVNFQKYKAVGFGFDTQMPKPEPRTVEYLPLSENQDIVPLVSGDAKGIDWSRQLDEAKEQFVRETGISRVLFDDPSVTLNSNQALLTSMKPTSDIAEAKKQLWGPIIAQMFMDALETIVAYKPELKEILNTDEDWTLRVVWPSVMQKEDPVYQSMLLNRFNAGTMSLQSYLEAQGDSKEEIDRIRDEIDDPITAAILAHQVPEVARKAIYQFMGMPPWGYITPKVNLRGELAPQEVGNMAHNYQWDQGPYGAEIGPQGFAGAQANQDQMNKGFLNPDGSAKYQNPSAQITTPAQNQPGQQPMSQPGSGATTTSAQGAVAQTSQNTGK